ncbi:hypothetical protein DBR40_26570 [Pedobacter sp. KBW01]|uniref:hypothetical protein n=1 Tax=Pedobacter sp. KBW01 TaxID=2153364 RepID=UPI000F5A152E|nr:hypothetical protein [Pedobacter sp. KBW01]RQO63981.1 hypothetical protein DBR40_26570 [Pedobacter sp. KBW01]
MKYIKILIGVAMVILVILYLNGQKFYRTLTCAMFDDFKRESYSGEVVKKFIDQKNHRTETVILDNGKNIYFVSDTSHFYEKINVGDIVRKIKNDSSLIVNSHGKLSTFNIYFGCKD